MRVCSSFWAVACLDWRFKLRLVLEVVEVEDAVEEKAWDLVLVDESWVLQSLAMWAPMHSLSLLRVLYYHIMSLPTISQDILE